jgi:hypothetical protein
VYIANAKRYVGGNGKIEVIQEVPFKVTVKPTHLEVGVHRIVCHSIEKRFRDVRGEHHRYYDQHSWSRREREPAWQAGRELQYFVVEQHRQGHQQQPQHKRKPSCHVSSWIRFALARTTYSYMHAGRGGKRTAVEKAKRPS